MRSLVILSMFVAVAMAGTCGPMQKLKVKNQWADVYGHSAETREQLGREVWDYIFEHEPKSRELLTRVRGDNMYSPDFAAHMVRIFGSLDIAISLMLNEDVMNAHLAHLHEQHVERNIPPEYFNLMEKALIHAIPNHHRNFDQDAWDACFHMIADPIAGV